MWAPKVAPKNKLRFRPLGCSQPVGAERCAPEKVPSQVGGRPLRGVGRATWAGGSVAVPPRATPHEAG